MAASKGKRLSGMSGQTGGFALVFLGGAVWGTTGPFIQLLLSLGCSSNLAAFIRMAFAFLIMLVATLALKGTSSLRLGPRDLAVCAALGIVGQGVYNIVYCASVQLVGVTVAAVLLNVAPVFGAVFSVALFHERMTWRKALILLATMAGCMLAATGGTLDLPSDGLAGIALGVAAGLCYALIPIISRFASPKVDTFAMSTYGYLFAALTLLPVAQPWGDPLVLQPAVLGAGLLIGLIPTGVAYLLYYRGVQQVSETSLIPVAASSETVVAAVLGVAFCGNVLGAGNVAGIAVVIASIAALGLLERGKA
jgi:drug/metabolite transporter, DME family